MTTCAPKPFGATFSWKCCAMSAQIAAMRSGALTSTAIFAAALPSLVPVQVGQAAGELLEGLVDRLLVDVQLHSRGSKCSGSVAPSRIDSSKP